MTTDYTDLKQHPFTRRRVYTGMLLFVVLVGGMMVMVPPLRHRLWDRIQALKSAITGDVKPISAQVGENLEPFPEEFVLPTPQAPVESPLPGVVYSVPLSNARSGAQAKSTAQSTRRIRIPGASGTASTPPVLIREGESGAPMDIFPIESSESGPKYQQGKIEQDAYDLVIKSNKALAEMVQGGDPSLHFKSWDVAYRGEDVYWVRVIFKSELKSDVAYIWQVKLTIGEITPLSFNARSLFNK
jgi:hypothetical protein